jgi:iron(III) transport system ATP-binding protein
VKLAVRAEGVTLHATRPAGPALAGRVSKASYLGNHLEYTVDTAHGALFVVDHVHAHPIAAGAEAWITFGERGTIVMPGDAAHGAP